ncbi:MAG: YtfJ family protein [Halioglobus sp.]
MSLKAIISAFVLGAIANYAQADTPILNSALPPLAIDDRGQMLLDGDSITYSPWSSDINPGKVHVLQYVAATRSASKAYSPFTDKLAEAFSPEDFHVTTIINLDDALWGTAGLVVSEVEDSKRKFPKSTLVVDENGAGLKSWDLSKKGFALAILDKQGSVVFFTQKPMAEGDLENMVNLVKSQIGG